MTGAGANHDLIDVEGTLTLNNTGGLTVALTSGYTGAFGDVFNLLDWSELDATYTSNGFTVGDRYRVGGETTWDLYLPTLSGGYLWDTSLFTTQGVIVVVPEPGRILLLALGLLTLLFRRRR
jgi:fibronectin-binding autotransporter adhesin